MRWKWYTISFVAKSSSSRVQQSYLTHTSLRKFLPRCVHSAGAGLLAPLYCLPMDDTFSAAAAAGSQLLTMCWCRVAATFSAQKLHAEQRSGVHNSLCWRALRWRAVRCAITTISSITSHLNPFVPVSELVLAPHFILPWMAMVATLALPMHKISDPQHACLASAHAAVARQILNTMAV